MFAALYALSAVATVLAWALARRRQEHRPVAVLLTVGLAADIATRALRAFYFARVIGELGTDARWTGVPRIMGHVADAVLLSWPATLAGAALVAFAGRRWWYATIGYAVALCVLIVVHPFAGDGSLASAIRTVHIIALAVAIGSAATWYLRTEPQGERVNSAQACLMLILCIELPSLAGAWRLGIFGNWNLSRIAYVVLYSLLIIIQGGWLWMPPRSSRSS
jgi:hypothetical protein